MSRHRRRARWLSWWPVSLLVSAALLGGGWWLSHQDGAAPSTRDGRTLADEAPSPGSDSCQSFLALELSTCIPRFPLHLSPPLAAPLDESQRDEVLMAGNAYDSAFYAESGLEPFAQLSPLQPPWDSALVAENVAGSAASVSFRRFVVLMNGVLRPHGFHTLEPCWEGRFSPCSGSPEGWAGWLRLRQPFTPSRFAETMKDALTRLDALLAATSEPGAPASPSPQAPRAVMSEEAPARRRRVDPQSEAVLPSVCPPRRTCETEQHQLTVALETNLHLSQSLEHLTEAPAARAEPLLRETAHPEADAGTRQRLTIPAKPYKWQKPPPCDPDQGEEAINGACWIETNSPAPCRKLAEHNGKCYIPIEKRQSAPPQSETRDGETD